MAKKRYRAAMSHPGWVSLPEAAERVCGKRYGSGHEQLRRLVADGVFTRGRFSGSERGRIFILEDELAAWRKGGVAAVKEVQKRKPAKVGA